MRKDTVYNRERALARLATWAGGPVLYLTADDLYRWQVQRSDEIQAEPLRTEMSNVRQFYRWACGRAALRADDPTLHLQMPRVSRRLPRPIADTQLAAAMADADTDVRAILALAAFAGLRAGEIARLDWAEVDMHGPRPQIHVLEGKGGHSRVVPLSPALAGELAALPASRGPVIRRLNGQPGQVKPHRISARANTYLHAAGVSETLHQCRHRFGIVTYQACRDLRAVQELLGHRSPTSTAIYTLAASDVSIDAVTAAGHLHVAPALRAAA